MSDMNSTSKSAAKDLRADLTPRIAVIGVGGAGGNAVNNMIAAGLEGVTFIVANTDAQALAASEAEHQIQLGVNLTEGLGAGSKPEIGEAAAEEAIEEIRDRIEGCHMVFVAAGMGGGTGTGAAAVVARVAHELDILTVGVVTKPFHFEGNRRMRAAEAGVAELARHVDTLIAIPNQNLFRIANDKTTFAQAFEMADQVLHAGISCVTDLIVREGLINLDFADVRAIMLDMGAAMMGTGEASGEQRAIEAAELAIANPLLDDVTLKGARGLLVSISGSDDLTLYEVDEAANRIREEVDPDANIIVGANFDPALGDKIRVSIVASGLRNAMTAMKSAEATLQTAERLEAPASARPESAPRQTTSQPLTASVGQQQGAAARPMTTPVQQPAGAAPGRAQTMPTRPQAKPESQSTQAGAQRQRFAPQMRPGKESAGRDGVRIQVGPPRMLTAGKLAKPLAPTPAREHNAVSANDQSTRDSGMANAAFMPAAPDQVKRTAPRMPEIDEFPPIAQREYKQKTTPEAPTKPARKRSRLFDRLKGGTGTDDAVVELKELVSEVSPQGPELDASSNSQDAEIPGFFKRQARK